jgi:hypothetical protein
VKYRLYIDEVGNPDLGASTDPNHRFLSLTGVALDLDYVTGEYHRNAAGVIEGWGRKWLP